MLQPDYKNLHMSMESEYWTGSLKYIFMEHIGSGAEMDIQTLKGLAGHPDSCKRITGRYRKCENRWQLKPGGEDFGLHKAGEESLLCTV